MTKKRQTLQEKKEQLIIDLINKMFEIARHDVTYDDIVDRKDDWYTQWTMTRYQNKQWCEWGIEEMRRVLKYNKKLATREMAFISLMWGLKFSDWDR